MIQIGETNVVYIYYPEFGGSIRKYFVWLKYINFFNKSTRQFKFISQVFPNAPSKDLIWLTTFIGFYRITATGIN